MHRGAAVSHNGSKPKVLTKIAQAIAAFSKGCEFGEIATYVLC